MPSRQYIKRAARALVNTFGRVDRLPPVYVTSMKSLREGIRQFYIDEVQRFSQVELPMAEYKRISEEVRRLIFTQVTTFKRLNYLDTNRLVFSFSPRIKNRTKQFDFLSGAVSNALVNGVRKKNPTLDKESLADVIAEAFQFDIQEYLHVILVKHLKDYYTSAKMTFTYLPPTGDTLIGNVIVDGPEIIRDFEDRVASEYAKRQDFSDFPGVAATAERRQLEAYKRKKHITVQSTEEGFSKVIQTFVDKGTLTKSEGPAPRRPTRPVSVTSLDNILTLLRNRLNQRVRQNMVKPALQYQTGRFARSVWAYSATSTPKAVLVQYTYRRNPYALFEFPGGDKGLATPNRDPRRIIGKAIEALVRTQTGLPVITRDI